MENHDPIVKVTLTGDYATEYRLKQQAHRRKLVQIVTKALLENPARQTQYQQSPHVVADTVKEMVAAILSETEPTEES